jgi:hypothetical protein
MDADLVFVIGVVAAIFSIVIIADTMTEGSVPRFGMTLFVTGLSLIAIALWLRPQTYTFQTVPDVFVAVLARFF